MLERIKAGEYLNRADYPLKREFETFTITDANGVVVIPSTPVPLDEDECDELRASWQAKNYDVKWNPAGPEFDAAREAYKAEGERIKAKFQADITEHFNFTGHPKAKHLFDFAWEAGNHYPEAVYNHYATMAVLLDPVPDLATKRATMFAAYSECLVYGGNMTPNDIADRLLTAL